MKDKAPATNPFVFVHIKKIICLLLLATALFKGMAQNFNTRISTNSIGKNQYVQVWYEIANASGIEDFQVPKFKDWIVVSGPMNSTSQSIINGQSSQSTSISYFLQPKHTGNLVIDGATAVINGKTLNSASKSVQVLNKVVDDQTGGTTQSTDPFAGLFSDPFAPQPPVVPQPPAESFRDAIILQPGENVPDKVKKNMFIKVVASKNSCYEGEPIMATYKLYSRLELTKLSVVRRPSFSGFSAFDMDQPDQPYALENIDGKNYKCWVIRKVQLYPLQAGQLTLEPAEVDCEIQFAKGEMVANGTYDPYSSNSFVRTNYSFKSTPVIVTAQELPTEGKPQNFNGAVGSFRIAAAVDDNAPGKGDAIHLGVRISGTGNFSMVHAPQVLWPTNTEAYDPKEIETLDKTAIPIAGDKLFDYTFLQHQPGKLTLPPISFSFFDIDSKSYKTIATQPIEIAVGNFSKHPVQIVTNSSNNWPVLFSRFAAVLLPVLAIVLVVILVFSFTRKKKKKEANREKSTNADAWQKLVNEAEQLKSAKENSSLVAQHTNPDTVNLQQAVYQHEAYLPVGLIEQVEPTTSVSEPSVARETAEYSFVQSEHLIWQDDHRLFYKCLKNEILQGLNNLAGVQTGKLETLEILKQKGADEEVLAQINSLIEECDATLYSPISNADDRQKILEEAKFLLGKV